MCLSAPRFLVAPMHEILIVCGDGIKQGWEALGHACVVCVWSVIVSVQAAWTVSDSAIRSVTGGDRTCELYFMN